MASGESVEVLNLKRLEDSTGGDTELIVELAELYIADTEARLPELLEAAEAQELERVGRVAHGLKGASASLGCDEAAAAFRRIEEMGRQGIGDDMDTAVEQAQAAWRRACERLREVAA
ncbi:MAG: Hpt domain-containing protein [Planctomycetota bacterium]|nr:Hpt domain-containing protein [Planctomycetota bacterium]